MYHTQVVQSPIFNDCLKVKIDDHTRPQIVPKFLLQLSIQEFYNSIVNEPEDGGLKEARYAENNIVISDYTLSSLLPPQLKNVRTIQVHMWLLMLYICQEYTFIITIMAWFLLKKH